MNFCAESLQKNKNRRGAFGQFLDSSVIGTAAANASAGVDGVTAQKRANGGGGYDAYSDTYPNHVFGPVNVIKNVSFRDQGLTFNQEFKLKFEYELRSFSGANPKILMLDQLANIMVLTSSQAPFWGGAVRYVGDGSTGKPLGDLSMIKSGNYSGFIKSVASGLGDMFKGVAKDIGGLMDGKDSKFLNNILGGTLMKMFNSPQGGQAAASLLTGDPTGSWHLTVGNPLNPVMMVGNLTCRETNVTFEGGMGVQDFPERMVLTPCAFSSLSKARCILGLRMSRSTRHTFKLDKAIMAPKFTPTNVFPSPDTDEVIEIT